MSAVTPVRRAARRTERSTALTTATRLGFIGYGLTHALIGWLALQVAWGHPGDESDQSGAFRTLAQQPPGRLLLGAVALGLAAMTVWQGLAAAFGNPAASGGSGWPYRLSSVGRTVVYGVLAWTAARMAFGSDTSAAQNQQDTTAKLLSG